MTMRAPSARQTETGMGFTRAPSISQRPLIWTGRKMPGRANDACQGRHQASLVEPDLVAGAELGGDGHELAVQLLDGEVFEVVVEPCAEALTGQKP